MAQNEQRLHLDPKRDSFDVIYFEVAKHCSV